LIVYIGEDSLPKAEPYLEHIESEEIKKLVLRLYEDQPDKTLHTPNEDESVMEKKETIDSASLTSDSHDQIVSEIDKLLENSTSLDEHASQDETPLPEFSATEKPKKTEKQKEKKRGFFNFFKK
jgi:hypothetical protein